jgi:hypothetical protein
MSWQVIYGSNVSTRTALYPCFGLCMTLATRTYAGTAHQLAPRMPGDYACLSTIADTVSIGSYPPYPLGGLSAVYTG